MSWFSKYVTRSDQGRNVKAFGQALGAGQASGTMPDPAAYGLTQKSGPGSNTSTTGLDPFTEKYRQELLNAQRTGANTPGGIDPYSQQALGFYGNAGNVGNLGLGALGGDMSAFQHFQNPYQQNVLDSLSPLFAQARSGALNDVRNAFSSPGGGAYGGSRQGVASGVALGQIANQEAQTKAGLTYQGFNDAMGRAGMAANLGFGGAQGASSLGQYAQMMADPNLRKAYLLRQGLSGVPYGQTFSQPINQNRGAGILGGALAGSQWGPWGAIGGGIIGSGWLG